MEFSPTPIEQLNYEQAFAELEKFINILENDQISLESATQYFELGQILTARCAELLEGAELKIRQLSGDELTALDNQEES